MRFSKLQVLCTVLLLAACSDDGGDSGPVCAQTLCTAGAMTCIGNSTAVCGTEGNRWDTNFCGATQQCKDGTCTKRACAFPGQSKCSGHDTVNTCSADGQTLTESKCDAGTLCSAGACRAAQCEVGAKECGFRKIAECSDNGGWKEIGCDPDQICSGGECVAQVCSPEKAECDIDARTARVCKADGSGWTETACADNEACYAGQCATKLCNPPSDEPDAGGSGDAEDGEVVEDAGEPVDTGPKAELEPLDKAEVVVDGEKIVFTSHKSASFVESGQDLRITMDKGQIKMEISITPIEEFDVPILSSTVQSDINVQIFYHDGSELIGGAQFRYVSVDYELELLKFQSAGGRVKGTFSGTFTDDGGATTVSFTNGEFDVKRHD